MMNYSIRTKIVFGIVVLLVVTVSGISSAQTMVDRMMRDIPVHPKGEVVYATTVQLNGRTVTAVVYDIHDDVDRVIEHYRGVLRKQEMKWTESSYPLDWLSIDGVRVHDFTVHDTDYRLLIPVTDELVPFRSLVAVTFGYDESIYVPGKENGGRDLSNLPRFPGSIRTLCLEYSGQDGNPPATVLLYETSSSVDAVKRHYSSVLERYGWISYQDYGMLLQSMAPGVQVPNMLTAFTDDMQCMIGIFSDEETGVTNIVIITFTVSRWGSF
jgi:hypothetical protein